MGVHGYGSYLGLESDRFAELIARFGRTSFSIALSCT